MSPNDPESTQGAKHPMTWSLTIADILPAKRTILWQLAKQAGVTAAVVSLPEGPDDPPVWTFETLLRLKQDFADDGIDLQVIESAPAVLMEPIKQGTDQFDWALDRFCEMIDNMGRAGIPVMCHNFMAGLGWLRTSMALPDEFEMSTPSRISTTSAYSGAETTTCPASIPLSR